MIKSKTYNTVPIIDIFAGPGGLGEGFSHVKDHKNKPFFKIALSVEMEKFAHKTLTLRSFYRQFLFNSLPIPEEYYEYLSGNISRKELFSKFPDKAKHAMNEAFNAELGKDSTYPPEYFDNRIESATKGHENWVLIGGPPCQAYSLAGRSRRTGGDTEEKRIFNLSVFEKDPKHTLYRQYLRILAVHRPSVFVMENVKGILSANHFAEPIFPKILHDLEDPRVALHYDKNTSSNKSQYYITSFTSQTITDNRDFIIKAEDYGIPQARHRVILLGIRKDFYNICKEKLEILSKEKPPTVYDIINDLPPIRSGLSKGSDNYENWASVLNDIPKQKWYNKLPADIKEEIDKVAFKKTRHTQRNSNTYTNITESSPLHSWFHEKNPIIVYNHESRGHIVEDIYRYVFAACFGKARKVSPKLADFPAELLPHHHNVMNYSRSKLKDAKFSDRFRVQIGIKPSTTITSHISKDGHYFIHPDPMQGRSLTVREAARLQTFPDDYYFEGPRTSQYHQVGNAVPPYLAYKIATIVAKLFKGD